MTQVRNSLLAATVAIASAASGTAQPGPMTLREMFDPDAVVRVRLVSNLTGRLAVPQPGKPMPDVLPFSGSSAFDYDELPLTPAADGALRVVRRYRSVDLTRTIGDQKQSAEVRAAVRRMVVLKPAGPAGGRKVPFSPDGALTLGEIELVRRDVFGPALVAGLLPDKAVSPGDKWPASTAAVAELTDYETVAANALTVEFVAAVTIHQRRMAKLAIAGTVAGTTEDGPSRQTLTGTAYFDLAAGRLSYLKLSGKSTLLGPNGVTTGELAGTFTLTREPTAAPAGLTATVLAATALEPTAANSRLLYADPTQGLQFEYPRRWRVGLTAGRQVALDEAGGKAGVLFTVYPAGQTPTAAAFLASGKAYAAKQGWPVAAESPISPGPPADRFTLDVTADGGPVRLAYAVVTTPAGGLTAAARLPAGTDQAALAADFEAVLKSLQRTKPAE